MGVLDPNAFYRAGFARGTKGRNPEVEERIARQQRMVNFAYEVVGNVAVKGIQNTFKSMQRFRDLSDSQTSSLNLKIDKLPRENQGLKDSIRQIHKNFQKAVRTSKLNISGKKRSQARQDMNKWMTQMQDINAILEVYKTNAEKAQGIAKVATGVAGSDNKAGNKNMNAGATPSEATNTMDQANGDMAQLLTWDIDEGAMYVLRGGEWVGEEGNRTYVSKSVQDKDAPSTITRKKYNEIGFAVEEDNTMENMLSEVKHTAVKDGYKTNSMSWDLYSSGKETAFKGAILNYSDDTFKDFYFGGYSFDYSTNRMDETAPAYRYLKDEKGLVPADDPNATKKDVAEWEGALLALKGQSFVKGSKFRVQVANNEWQNMKTEYENAKLESQKVQAEADRKAAGGKGYKPYQNYTVDGYTGIDYSTAKKQYDNMLIPGKVNYDRSKGYKYIADKNGMTKIYIQDVNPKNTATYGKYIFLEEVKTNDALARRGLDIFGEGYTGKTKEDDVISLYLQSKNPNNAGYTGDDNIPDMFQPEISNLQR